MPCSRYTEADIRNIMNVMRKALQPAIPPVLCIQTFFYKHTFITASESQSAILRIPVGQLKVTEFRYYLANCIPVVIINLNNKLQLSWSPSHLIREHGADICSLEDCEGREKPVKRRLKACLQLFMNVEVKDNILSPAIWRIKAWS
jgi:hypothetical protein